MDGMHMGLITQAVVPKFLNTYTAILNGVSDRKKAKDYGKLVQWEDDEDAFLWMTTRRQFHPGQSLLILEAQEHLMAFLVDCCRQILLDVPDQIISDDHYPSQLEPLLKSETDISGHDSLAVIATERPYRLLVPRNLSRVSLFLDSITIAKEDHL